VDTCVCVWCTIKRVISNHPAPWVYVPLLWSTGSPSTHHTSTIQKLNHKSVTQPTVELKSIANTILNELHGEVEDDAHQTTFNTQLAQISLIRTRQLNDYLKVCVLRLQHEDPHNTSEKITHRVQDHVSILKAILST
jgi:hypothetical protein